MISVIVPVYNSEDYLHVCLNSLLKQTYSDFEIICIDDNSSDSSLEILDFFSKKDSRINIIKNNYNRGIGDCLNKGLSVAKGEYIYFLDSKDWLSFNSFELLIKKIETDLSDFIIFKNSFYNENTCSFSVYDFGKLYVKNEVFNHYDLEKNNLFKLRLGAYNAFYLKSFLKKINLNLIDENKDWIYDVIFYKTFINAKRISIINKNLCNVREFTRNHELRKNILLDEINRKYNIFKIFLENKDIYEYYKKDLFDFCFNSTLNSIVNNYEKKILYQINLIFQELILKYGLNDDVRLHMDDNLLTQFGFDELMIDLKDSYPIISVIVPVYNVEDFLPRCLNSICNQSFKNIEIICINDGSTDASRDILENFAENDLRISVITQKNGGLGFARNVGMQHAKGDYILFIDSDDFIELDAIEYSYNNLISNESDLAIFKFSRFTDETITYLQTGFPLDDLFGNVNYSMFTFTYKDIKKYVLNSSFSAWSKIYKKDFLDKFDSSFQVGIAYEDVLFHIKSLLNASSISFIPKFIYNYRLSNTASIMHNKSKIFDIFEITEQVENYLKVNNYYGEFKFEFLLFKITQLSQYLEKADSEEYFEKVKYEFEDLFNKNEYIPDDFNRLPFRLKNRFYSVLNSKNYEDFLKDIEKNEK